MASGGGTLGAPSAAHAGLVATDDPSVTAVVECSAGPSRGVTCTTTSTRDSPGGCTVQAGLIVPARGAPRAGGGGAPFWGGGGGGGPGGPRGPPPLGGGGGGGG